jgi:hypothetical protein
MTVQAQLPLVGVVIPVFNDWSGVQLCLRALAAQRYPRERLRVRVVDNGSSDWPAQPQFPLPVEVMHHSLPGSYGARNRAALGWNVDLLAFTDADCRPDPQWLTEAVQAWQGQASANCLLAGRIVLEARDVAAPTAAEQLDQILGFDQSRTVRRGGFAVTANLLVPQPCFERLGGFDASTRSGGDKDFCRRALAAGCSLHVASGALIRHPARQWPELLHKQRRIVGGQLSLADPTVAARLAVLWRALRPLVSESVRVCRAPRLPLPRRAQLLLLVVRLRMAVLQEWMRLQALDQQPLR